MSRNVQKILVPTDFSEFSQNAIDYACDLAQGQRRAQVHLVHVISSAPGGEAQTEKIRSRLEKLGSSVDARLELDTETVKQVIPGHPYRVITDYAREHDVDMIVMGTHGRTGLSHFALGSVAERVVRNSTCPVLVLGAHSGNGELTLAQAAEQIGELLGAEFSAGSDDGIEKMQTCLENSLGLSPRRSARMIEQLRRAEWLHFDDGDPGTWRLMEGNSLVENPPPPRVTEKSESQAVDLIQRARRLRATDIHLDPAEGNEVRVRFRIDGKLEEYCRLNELVGDHLQNQLKTMAELNLAEPFRPQEGRVRLPSEIDDLEVRLTTARVAAGDAIALRLFDCKNIFLPLQSLGLSDASLEAVNRMLRAGEGLVLVTGPTGSGKTTTVYSMLESLGGVDTNIVSVEDPVEFAVPFVRQMNVDETHGITMTSGLRTILRMDPDVVFLGEIRDPEAAQIAMRAASSGKYVLSTLHTRDVASTITSLRDMEIASGSISGNVTGIINQRLIRRLCPNCKQAAPLTESHRRQFAESEVEAPDELYVPKGCSMCRETGYRGRIGVFEVALMDKRLTNAVAGGDAESHLCELLRNSGVVSLTTDALTKVAGGITNYEEALSVRWLN